MRVEFRLLGPVEIWAGGQLVNAGEPRRRAVLAALLFDAGTVVPSTTLIDRVWGEDPPTRAIKTLGTHVTRIRRVLEQAAGDHEPVALASQTGGYRLAVDRDRVDLHRFRRLVQEARDPATTGEQRVAMLREALALWRGEPLTGIPGDWAGRTRDHLVRERLEAIAAWADAELDVNNGAAVLAPLAELASEHPMMEPLTVALMRALVAAGRPGEALERCRAHRQQLIDEQGIEQGPQLRALYDAILRDDGQPPPWREAPEGAPTALANGAFPPSDALGPDGGTPTASASPQAAGSPARKSSPPPAVPQADMAQTAAPQAAPPPTGRSRLRRQFALAGGAFAVVIAVSAGAAYVGADRLDGRPSRVPLEAVAPTASEEFTDGLPAEWKPYEQAWPNGSAWSPSAVRVSGGELQIVGTGRNPTGKGNIAGGACWCKPGGKMRTYGRWQVHAKFDQGAGYGPMIGLYPADDKVDPSLLTVARLDQPSRSSLYPEVEDATGEGIDLSARSGDFTNWATYEVEWRRDFVKISVDNQVLFDSRHSPEPMVIPYRPMYLYVQMMPGPDGAVPAADNDTPSHVVTHVDWAKYYA